MKKLLLTVVAVAAMVSAVSAQGFGYGVKAGINVANEKVKVGDVSSTSSSKVGLTAGLFADYRWQSGLAVSADLLYSNLGGKDGDLKDNFHYLNIPIQLNYYIIDGLAVKAGIQPGFLLSAKEDGDSMDMKDFMKTLDVSIPVGVSYEFPIGLIIDARYNIGVANVVDVDGIKGHNRFFSVTLGYRF